mmetsp:Transcript_56380/g.138396  ORF Transcript_56380/g.138396 Transcript_56380/m.138396 type:complete len:118 (+) Transcript_56380:621-974(+)
MHDDAAHHSCTTLSSDDEALLAPDWLAQLAQGSSVLSEHVDSPHDGLRPLSGPRIRSGDAGLPGPMKAIRFDRPAPPGASWLSGGGSHSGSPVGSRGGERSAGRFVIGVCGILVSSL